MTKTTQFGQDLIASMKEAVAHANNEITLRTTEVMVADARTIREDLHMSQQEFASAYKIPLATLKGWEQGRRRPDATASAYLNVIAHLPEAAREALRVD